MKGLWRLQGTDQVERYRNGSWTSLNQSASDIAVRDSCDVMIVTKLDSWKSDTLKVLREGEWIDIEGAPEQVARIALNQLGNPYVVTIYGQIYHFDGSLWKQIPGDANEIAIGVDGSVWTLNAYGQPQFITTETIEKFNVEQFCDSGSDYRGF